MSIVRVGSNKKYAEGWELIFGRGNSRRKKNSGSSKTGRTTARKKTRKKK